MPSQHQKRQGTMQVLKEHPEQQAQEKQPKQGRAGPPAAREALFLMYEDDGFEPPRSEEVLLHWVRALVHMYCLSFQQLERLASEEHVRMLGHAGKDAKDGDWEFLANGVVPAARKRDMWDCLQHMIHAWCMLGRCVDTPAWRAHAATACAKGVPREASRPSPFVSDACDIYTPLTHTYGPSQLMGWMCEMPWTTDEAYVRRSLAFTMRHDCYPRMCKEPNCIREGMDGCAGPFACPPSGSGAALPPYDPQCPYYVSVNVLAWLVTGLYGLPWACAPCMPESPPVRFQVMQAPNAPGAKWCIGRSAPGGPRSDDDGLVQGCPLFGQPRDALTMLSVPRQFMPMGVYLLMQECVRSYGAIRTSTPITVKRLGGGCMYHMQRGTSTSYDNLSGSSARAMVWAASMGTVAAASAIVTPTTGCVRMHARRGIASFAYSRIGDKGKKKKGQGWVDDDEAGLLPTGAAGLVDRRGILRAVRPEESPEATFVAGVLRSMARQDMMGAAARETVVFSIEEVGEEEAEKKEGELKKQGKIGNKELWPDIVQEKRRQQQQQEQEQQKEAIAMLMCRNDDAASALVEGLRMAPHTSWRRGAKIASIGHIVVGWAAYMLRGVQ